MKFKNISTGLKNEIFNLHISTGKGRRSIAKIYNMPDWTIRKILKECKEKEFSEIKDEDLISHSVNLELKNQDLKDKLRVNNKINRDEYRETNHINKLTQELIDCVKNKQPPITIKHKTKDKKSSIGIVQLSDCHFNEIIDTQNNQYDFNIASMRCKKFITDAIPYLLINNVETVVFCMTGDMLNSDRRPDEKVSMVTSRAKACYLASIIIEQMILELNVFFNVKVAFVVGNESRSFDIGNTDIIFSDNFDLTIVSMLKLMFRDSNVEFLYSNLKDCILNIKDKNILLTHGEKINDKNIQKSIQDIKGRYTQNGAIIDYVILGHIHSASCSDMYSRSSSLSGGNGYSENDLGFASRASQNIYIVEDWINCIKIDLQNTDDVEGYYIDSDLVDDLNECKDNINFNVIKI